MPSLYISCLPRRYSAPVERSRIRFARGTKAASEASSGTSISSSSPPSKPSFDMDTAMSSSLPTTHLSRQIHGICHTHIHHLLAGCDNQHGPMINFDLTLPPYSVLLPHQRGEPATYPPQRKISISYEFLPWPIEIQSSPFVTVYDVLEKLYSELRHGVSAEEFAHYVPLQAQRRASEAYRKRYRRLVDPEQYQTEKKKGLRRVDLLLENHFFLGLTSTTNGPTVWKLRVTGS